LTLTQEVHIRLSRHPVVPNIDAKEVSAVLNAQPLVFTAHAQARCQQRAVRRDAIEKILDHGRPARVGGAESYFLDKAGRRRLREDLGECGFRAIERWLNAYVVVADDGRIITVARRIRRLRRH
jgi:hypothetical protein